MTLRSVTSAGLLVLVASVAPMLAPGGADAGNNSRLPGSVLIFTRFVGGTEGGLPRSSFEVSVVCPAGRTCPEPVPVRIRARWICPGTSNGSPCPSSEFTLRTIVDGTLWFNPENDPDALSPFQSPAPSPPVATPVVVAPPCPRGALVLWVVDDSSRPISFNGLVGDAVLLEQGAVSAYEALPIQAVPGVGKVLSQDPAAPLAFDDKQYAALPGRVLAPVRYETAGVQTTLTLLSLGIHLGASNPATTLPLTFFNENERSIATGTRFGCWQERRLTAIHPALTTTFGGLGATKGLAASSGGTVQETAAPFSVVPVPVVGLVQTTVGTGEGARPVVAYSMSQDGPGVPSVLCHDPQSTCALSAAGGTGKFELSPKRDAVAVGERVRYALIWTVPEPRVWRELDTLYVRICGDDGTAPVLLVQWDELSNTFSVLDTATGEFGPPATPGSPGQLETDGATLFLSETAVQGSGPTGRSVTLTLALEFKASAAGRACDVDVAATDDLGHFDEFKKAGKVHITAQ